MAYYTTLRNYQFEPRVADDIRGSTVRGLNDDKLGKIDDVIFDPNTNNIRYAIIDTGGWLRTKRFIVPADRIHGSATHEDDFEVTLTKEQIESFPAYDENALESQEKWQTYETQYLSAWPSTSEPYTGESSNRWTSFEDRLRSDRDRIAASGTSSPRRKVS
jgi:hypothetical protein